MSAPDRFFQLSNANKRIVLQQFALLGLYRLAVALLPFRWLTRPLKHHRPEQTAAPDISDTDLETALHLAMLLSRTARHTPWTSTCLTQVLVLQYNLRKRSIPGCFYLGVRHLNPPEGLDAHAWLRCGDEVINGGETAKLFTVVSAFSW